MCCLCREEVEWPATESICHDIANARKMIEVEVVLGQGQDPTSLARRKARLPQKMRNCGVICVEVEFRPKKVVPPGPQSRDHSKHLSLIRHVNSFCGGELLAVICHHLFQ